MFSTWFQPSLIYFVAFLISSSIYVVIQRATSTNRLIPDNVPQASPLVLKPLVQECLLMTGLTGKLVIDLPASFTSNHPIKAKRTWRTAGKRKMDLLSPLSLGSSMSFYSKIDNAGCSQFLVPTRINPTILLYMSAMGFQATKNVTEFLRHKTSLTQISKKICTSYNIKQQILVNVAERLLLY